MSRVDSASRSGPDFSVPSGPAAAAGQPQAPREGGQAEWIVLGLAAAWITALLLLEWPALFQDTWESRISVDSAVFGYAGELLRTGEQPYLSYWDHKGPLIHLLNAAGLALGGGEVWGVWLVSFASLLGALLLGYAALRRAFGALGAILGTAFFVVALPSVYASNLTEAYALPVQWGAVLLFLQRCSTPGKQFSTGAVLGIVASLGFFLRANLIGAAVSVGVVLSILLLTERRIGAWLRFVAGGVSGVGVAAVVLVAYLAQEGALSAAWEQVFAYNFLYSGTTWKRRILSAYAGIRFPTEYGPLVFPLAGWLYASYRLYTRRRSDPLYSILVLGVVWLPVELLLSSMAGRVFDHYFTVLLAPLAYLTGVFTVIIRGASQPVARALAPWSPRVLVLVLAAGIALPRLGDTAVTLWENGGVARPRTDQVSATVDYIRTRTAPGDAIFVWGHAPDLYFFSGRRAASRFIYPAPLLTPGYADTKLVQGFMDELRARTPALIIDASAVEGLAPPLELVPSLATWNPEWHLPTYYPPDKSWWSMTPELKAFYDFVAANYTPVTTIGPVGWTIYERTSSASARGAP